MLQRKLLDHRNCVNDRRKMANTSPRTGTSKKPSAVAVTLKGQSPGLEKLKYCMSTYVFLPGQKDHHLRF